MTRYRPSSPVVAQWRMRAVSVSNHGDYSVEGLRRVPRTSCRVSQDARIHVAVAARIRIPDYPNIPSRRNTFINTCYRGVPSMGTAFLVTALEASTMIVWAKVVYVASFLVLLTLPFNSLLNRRFVVFPLSVVCLTAGLIAMYYCTLPDKPRQSRHSGGRS